MSNYRMLPSRITILFAYSSGIVYWLGYLLKGAPTYTVNDWLKEQVFSNLVRKAFDTLSVPWRMSVDFYHAGAHELIANPEVSLTPDVFLLSVLPNNTYFVAHLLLFFSLGFLGAVLLARKYQLTSMSFLFMVALLNFNGYLGAHFSEGHVQWAGCFLLPWFFYWLSGLDESAKPDRISSALKITLLLGVLFLNGSFHMAIWCLMFLAIVLMYRRDMAPQIGLVIALALLMAVARLLPAALYFPEKSGFVSGYPSLSTLLDAFTYVYNPANPNGTGAHGDLKWHEYSFYIGYVGFCFIMVGAYQYAKARLHAVPTWWLPAALAMFMFSLGDVYQLIPNSGIPLSSIERVGSRFIVLPYTVLVLIAAVGFSNLERHYRSQTRLVLGVGLIVMLGEIYQNARKWRIQSYEEVFGVNKIPVVYLVESHDAILKMVVAGSWLVSALTAVAVIIGLYKLWRKTT